MLARKNISQCSEWSENTKNFQGYYFCRWVVWTGRGRFWVLCLFPCIRLRVSPSWRPRSRYDDRSPACFPSCFSRSADEPRQKKNSNNDVLKTGASHRNNSCMLLSNAIVRVFVLIVLPFLLAAVCRSPSSSLSSTSKPGRQPEWSLFYQPIAATDSAVQAGKRKGQSSPCWRKPVRAG